MKIAILGSGAGSNAQAIINATDNNQIGNAEIVGIFSDKENAPILHHAQKKHIYSEGGEPPEGALRLEGPICQKSMFFSEASEPPEGALRSWGPICIYPPLPRSISHRFGSIFRASGVGSPAGLIRPQRSVIWPY